MKGQARTYRRIASPEGMVGYRLTVRETDLQIYSRTALPDLARETVLQVRGHIEAYIQQHPDFLKTMIPWEGGAAAPPVVRAMIQAGRLAGVGPMAAVAGAVAEAVGRVLLDHSPEVIVENGGDIFLKTEHPPVIALHAGKSPLSLKIGLRPEHDPNPMAVCTSSGTVGHSLSLGSADAVCVLSQDAALADAAATAVGNRVSGAADIGAAMGFGRGIEGVKGLVIVCGRQIGAWGAVELMPLSAGRSGGLQGGK
jgi:ApbE superfamily uncharacterized protein (UPF0280 family)